MIPSAFKLEWHCAQAQRAFRATLVLISAFHAYRDSLSAQVPEIAALQHSVAAIRAQMPRITAAAELAARMMTEQPSARLLISHDMSPAVWQEFFWHTGAGSELSDPAGAVGVVLMPVRAWDAGVFTIGAMIDRWQGAGNPVIVFGPAAGKPDVLSSNRWFIDDGATDGTHLSTEINGVSNLIAMWTFYVEFAAAATRQGWYPSIYASQLVPNASEINAHLAFRGAGAATPIVSGSAGTTYLRYVDSLLDLAARPAHVALVQRAADSLRAVRAAHHALFVGACAHYLEQEVLLDRNDSPFTPFDGQWDAAGPFRTAGGAVGDGVLWFGYGGYNCPHADAQGPLAAVGARVVVVADNLDPRPTPGVMVKVPLDWKLPEHAVNAGWNPEGMGSASSIDAALHYLWIKRLVREP